jgi:esterase
VSAVALVYDDLGAGPPLIILHGLFGSARNWQRYAKELSSHYRVIAVDLRNHGRSPHTTTHTYLDLADDIEALLDALELGDVVILGHSMGGKAAMTLALRSPARISKLIVVDIAPIAYADHHTPLIDAMLALPLTTTTRRAAEIFLTEAVPDQAIRLFLLQNLILGEPGIGWRLNLPVLKNAMPTLVGALPVAAAAMFGGAVHFIRGGLSDRVLDSHRPVIEAHFPRVVIHTVDNGGHWPHAEAPAEFRTRLAIALAS